MRNMIHWSGWRLVTIILLAFMLLGLGAQAGYAAPVVNERFIQEGVFFNDCTGEDLDYSLVAHLQIHETTTPHGDTNWGGEVNANIKAVGQTSGLRYTGHIGQQVSIKLDPDEEEIVYSDHIRLVFNSQGNADNLHLYASLHFTINANGDLTSFRAVPETVVCRG